MSATTITNHELTDAGVAEADARVDADTAGRSTQTAARRFRKPILIAVGLVAVAAAAVEGARALAVARSVEETDDAQVEGHIDPVLPRVAGQVIAVAVQENQVVKAGDVLARLDDRDLRAKEQMAEAALANAEAAVAVAEANVQAALAAKIRAAGDLERYALLLPAEEISRQQYAAAEATTHAAEAQHAASLRQVTAARAQIAQKQADLDYARLQVSYTTIVAPVAGVVSKKTVEVGQYVQAGQPLLAIAQGGDVWVVANYKETQLGRMRVGQPVAVHVDAYPGQVVHGTVESIAAATGARFALLPPDNASGNFTKVVQRVPVRIALDPRDAERAPLRIGMSVATRVQVR